MTDRDTQCADVLERIPLFVGADLDEETARRVVDHLERCEPCRAAEGQAAESRARLVEAFEAEVRGGGPNLWSGIRAGLVEQGRIVGAPAPLLAGPWRRVAALAAAAAVLAVVLVPLLRTGVPEDSTVDLVENGSGVEMDFDAPRLVEPAPGEAGASAPAHPGGLVPRRPGDFLSEQILPNGQDPLHDLASSPIR